MQRISAILPEVLISAVLFSGCGGGNLMKSPPPPQALQPSIVAISPTTVPAGSGGFALTITGTGLSMNTQVKFGSAVLMPTSVAQGNCPGGGSCTVLTVNVPAQNVANAGTIIVSVANSSMVSNDVAFAVTPQSGSITGAPQLLLFSPMIAPVSSASFQLVVAAENVAQGATVNFGSLSLTPTSSGVTFYPSSAALSTLMVQVPATAIATPGMVTVSVTNPGASGGTSNQGDFFIVSKGTFPIEESLSNDHPPVAGNAPSTHSSTMIDGFVVTFDSTATNLVTGATSGLSQVYVRHNCFGTTATCIANQTQLVSVAPDGSPGAGGTNGSDKPTISQDGRFIVFESDDTNLVPGATQAVEQIYLRDTCQSILGPAKNCTPQTILVSASPSGEPGNAPSTNPVAGAFGLFVAFQSSATNLVSQSTPSGVQQIYLWRGCNALLDATAGCQSGITLESVDASGKAGNKDSTNPALNEGLVVAFQSLADNLVANTPGNGFQQIYLRNTCLALTSPAPGVPCGNNPQAVSLDSNGHLGTGDSVTPGVGAFGMVTVFATRAPNLLPPNTSNQQIVAFNTCFAVPEIPCVASKGGVISVDQNGMPGQGGSSHPTITGLDRVAFTSQASLVLGVTGQQVYGVNGSFPCAQAGPCPWMPPVLVSVDSSGKPMGGDYAALDLAGQFATFSSVGPGSTSGPTQIFLTAPFF
jgi:hypothetical protein